MPKLSKSSVPPSPSTATPASLTNALPLPKIIVFDLDYTLWPFWVDTHVLPPLKPNAAHTAAQDRRGEHFAFYADVPAILLALPRLGVRTGVASRTSAPPLARDLLKMLHLADPDAGGKPRKALDVFDAGLEIYPGSKTKHFETLHKRTGVPYEDMLFFDDESRNKNTEALGVTMWLVPDGVSWGEIERGVAEWRRRRGHV
ncbi:hypothetical protein S40285_02880 [Stachybotrys chlorohalonatus IBT 40285]|jgi:magnesium-dependent phosphatase 1|uniref:Magnesium-dependent phosphatase-1 n=1 Tax=Stachybotrys chlorohalonatus (strain IBT 40285) TaxID=1283841 RepID=A0A084QLQ2_STAC4|nr:hypothetical protein S40285_02880 [Stachybotrys chlorohalonata IBT 40285]